MSSWRARETKVRDMLRVRVCCTSPRTGPKGISTFIVEKGTPGLSFGGKEHKVWCVQRVL
jgi:alkylation response protein AidB-like acyl-CoA dehydrogenase